MKLDNKLLMEMLDQELDSISTEPRKEPNDHEGSMAKSELRDMIKNGLILYKLINQDDELPGWASSYITLASDYVNSVASFMIEEKQSGTQEFENIEDESDT